MSRIAVLMMIILTGCWAASGLDLHTNRVTRINAQIALNRR